MKRRFFNIICAFLFLLLSPILLFSLDLTYELTGNVETENLLLNLTINSKEHIKFMLNFNSNNVEVFSLNPLNIFEIKSKKLVLKFPIHFKKEITGNCSIELIAKYKKKEETKIIKQEIIFFIDKNESLLNSHRNYFCSFSKDDFVIFHTKIYIDKVLKDNFIHGLYSSIKNNKLNKYEIQLMKKYQMNPVDSKM